VRKDGSRFWANVIITALYDATGVHRGFAKVTRDLTQKRKINALEDEGRRVTNFLAMLGHELRNPLAPIVNSLAVLEMEMPDAAQMHSLHKIIARQTRQMSRLIDDLLDVSRIISGKVHLNKAPVKLRDAAMAAVESVAPLIQKKSHVLTVDMTAELWVGGDFARLVQILVNLLTNAAKFTPPAGRITLHVGRDQTRAIISVKDNGPGIPANLLPHIFKLFFQGEQDISRSHGGLGLGLSLVRELVKLHGGEIAVFSPDQPHTGSEFIIHLPIVESPLQHSPTHDQRSDGQGQRILVVDDNRDAADTMKLLLEALGYEATAVYDGNAALHSISQSEPAVVLLDIGLPGISGLEIARQIVGKNSKAPLLIAVTGYGQDADRAASSAAGFHAHLTKPVALTDLTELLAKIFDNA
ncbi:MAG TPA: ATP-binding protein, partial [Spongiibacteraceae bacterium]|nr:ATP-binding protein [Spongiibacteraceae bacterium]